MLLELLSRIGGVASLEALSRGGVTRRDLDHAVRVGAVVRVRNGWYALPTAPNDVVRAVRVGGVLSCTSLLTHLGVWCLDDGRLHVRVPPYASRLRSPDDRTVALSKERHRVAVHAPELALGSAAVDGIEGALSSVMLCSPAPYAVAALDAALNKRLLTLDDLRAIPGRHSRLLELVDPSAQSGLETLVRLSLRGRRVRIRPQVPIRQVGFVDLLVGDRLVIELDGWEFHGTRRAFEEDRRRDLELTRQGYEGMRLTYAQVFTDWRSVEAVILEKVRRREHLWSARHRRAGMA